jgi:uncharacterized beta-barrel protein YwiB (DUF1934 family)
MNKDVKIKITGTHGKGSDKEVLKTHTEGLYYEKNGKNYIRYTEVDPETNAKRKAMIKIEGKTVTVEYRGIAETTMVFDVGNTTRSMYVTSLGSMLLEIDTETLTIDEKEESLEIFIRYRMALANTDPADATIHIHVTE